MLQKTPCSGPGPFRGLFVLGFLFLAVQLWGIAAFTAEETTPFATSRGALLPSSFEKNPSHFGAQVRMESIQYLTALPSSPELSQSQFLSARLSYSGKNSWFQSVAEMGAGTFFGRNESHLLVQELYTTPQTQNYTGDFRVSLGRKKVEWSGVDSNWDLGVWQPYYEIDTLRPEQQGLTGAFFDFDQENFRLVGFATPLFVPNMGMTVHEEDGGLVTQSRWVQTPPREAGFGDKVNSLNYQLTVPEAGALANHAGYSVLGRVGRKDRGFWGTSSYGYKPVNQLLIGRQVRHAVSSQETGVKVVPQVTYHTVFAVDAGYSAGNSGVTFSYLQDVPAEVLPMERWVVQKLAPLTVVAAGVFWQVPALRTRFVMLRLDYLKASGGEVEDIGSDGFRDVMSQDQMRLKFSNAVRLRAQGELARIDRRPLIAEISWLYDQDQQGTMLNSELQYFPGEKWAILAGADFLGVEDETRNPSTFLSQYRANDRVYGGMSYVF
jgi:hypothetical protein